MPRINILAISLTWVLCGSAWAQQIPVTPATPKSFRARSTGASMDATATVHPQRSAAEVRGTDSGSAKVWTNSEGKTILAHWIRHDDGSLAKDGSILLARVGQSNPASVSVASLAKADQDYVASLAGKVVAKREGEESRAKAVAAPAGSAGK